MVITDERRQKSVGLLLHFLFKFENKIITVTFSENCFFSQFQMLVLYFFFARYFDMYEIVSLMDMFSEILPVRTSSIKPSSVVLLDQRTVHDCCLTCTISWNRTG